MTRRELLRYAGSAAAGTLRDWTSLARGQEPTTYHATGVGPALISLDPMLRSHSDRLTNSYRVILPDDSPGRVEPFTADGVCADILAIADAAGVERFAWCGFSWGAVVGLQLATRTDRLSALICGGWPRSAVSTEKLSRSLRLPQREVKVSASQPSITAFRDGQNGRWFPGFRSHGWRSLAARTSSKPTGTRSASVHC